MNFHMRQSDLESTFKRNQNVFQKKKNAVIDEEEYDEDVESSTKTDPKDTDENDFDNNFGNLNSQWERSTMIKR